ncbi:hypothetical protein O0L34_g16632 [Tuta absoluta]|nr:hypothetical protein O0L34_g16632 [Tuta absoluta]
MYTYFFILTEQPKSTEKYEDASLWEQNTAAAAKTIEYDDIDESQVSPEDVEKEIMFSWQKPVEVIDDTDDQPDEAWARKEEGEVTMHFYKCNICSKDISGSRYVCVQCVDFDLCALCEAAHTHDQHYVLRVPQPKPHSEVMAVLRIIRHALVMDAIVDVSAHTQP